ncbi:hypothetical protein ABZ990_18955 [Streptomyces sp. NPDC046203]|uniref:hypothetical protein n=1 Tax=Streptomyces sp. NPDC046203 TaxID=3154602 RepID=UPI0033DDA3FB
MFLGEPSSVLLRFALGASREECFEECFEECLEERFEGERAVLVRYAAHGT